MTGDQGHRNDITIGQRVSRHSLPTLLYYLFSPPHIFFKSNKRSDSRAPLKDKLNKRVIYGSSTNGTFASRTTLPTTQACKRAVFCPRTDINNDIHNLNFDNR